ncbi:hypothetical protein C2S52_004788 [Perilla frutescens var. hirtella]|nr:hypothetical protein C2S52_004788 [Perilla frutescens var. hirtella]
MMKNKGKYKHKSKGRHSDYYDEYGYDSDNNMMSQNGNVRRKMCTEWTQELHAQFMDAVTSLSEGRCFPKDILEMMNESGLTRMQVASHLQKCRNDNWRSPEERKPTHITSQHSSQNRNRTQSKPRRCESMTLGNRPSSSQIQSKTPETVIASNNIGPVRGVEFREVAHQRSENPNPNPKIMIKNNGKYKHKSRDRHNDYYDEDGYDLDNNMMSQNGNVRRKMCTKWTQELHAKFMDVVTSLGEESCFPKEILEMMNESGLTRMQVASHLQKCRNDNWRSPEERKPTHITSQHSSQNGNRTQSKPRRCGSMTLGNQSSSSQIQSKLRNPLGVRITKQRVIASNSIEPNKGKYKQKSRGRHSDYYDEDGYDSDNNLMSQNGNVRRKMCTEWTQELHITFMDAVMSVGEGKRKPTHITSQQSSQNGNRTQSKTRRFGSMPLGNRPPRARSNQRLKKRVKAPEPVRSPNHQTTSNCIQQHRPVRGVEFRQVAHQRGENPNPNLNIMMKNKGKYKQKSRGRHSDYYDEDGYDSDNNLMSQNGNVKRKMCTEWTQELHVTFMDAVMSVGEGRCFPKEILEMMNELGLTIMQVASHLQNKGKYKQKSRGRHSDYYDEDGYDLDNNIMSQNGNVRRKMCTEWTQEPHAKFMDAVTSLGEGRCFPKEILEMMNESGLTRMQVASLQKCRNDDWRSPEEQKSTHITSQQSSQNGNRAQSKPRRFGSMPLGNRPSSSQIQSKTQETGQSSGTRWESESPNNEAKMGHGSTMTNNTRKS